MVLNLDGGLWNVVEFQHVKPGKGGAFVRTKLKNVTSGKVVDRTFNAGVKVETATVDKREMQYLYKRRRRLRLHGHRVLRPDPRARRDGRRRGQLHAGEHQSATVAVHEGAPLYVELPASVELTISYTEPGLQGDRSTGGTKPATLETGCEIAGAAVPGDRRARSRSTPATAATSAVSTGCAGGQDASRRWLPVERHKARKRALDILTRQRCAASRRAVTGQRVGPAEPAVNPYTVAAGRGRRRASRADRRADRRLRRRTGRWSGCQRWTATCCGSGHFELLYGRTCPTGVADQRGGGPGRQALDGGARAFVNGLLARIRGRAELAGRARSGRSATPSGSDGLATASPRGGPRLARPR